MSNFVVTVSWTRNNERGTCPFSVASVMDQEEATKKAFKNAQSAMSIPSGASLSVKSIVKD